MIIDWMIKYIKWDASERLCEGQIIQIKFDIFRQLSNLIKLTCNDNIKDLHFLYLELKEDNINTLKEFILKIN
jgi:hypothetical protein